MLNAAGASGGPCPKWRVPAGETGPSILLLVDGKPHFVLGGELGNSTASSTAYVSVDEGHSEGTKWVPGRRMNGDEDCQGRCVRVPGNEYLIQHVKLYT